jgi:hypothetical protein
MFGWPNVNECFDGDRSLEGKREGGGADVSNVKEQKMEIEWMK